MIDRNFIFDLTTNAVGQNIIYYILAEFIIHLAEENAQFESFKRILLENGAEFSVRLIYFLFSTNIQAIKY